MTSQPAVDRLWAESAAGVEIGDRSVRRARPADGDALAELASTSFRDAYRLIDDPRDIDDYVARNFTPAVFASILADSSSTVLLALDRRGMVGYAHIRRSVAPPCVTGPAPIELARLYLRQETVGKGYGSALMHAVHAEARRQGGQTLWLAVYERNLRARDFYRRWGCVDVGTRTFLFGGRSYADPVLSAPVLADCQE
jgi:diamine N-acetyltransferase